MNENTKIKLGEMLTDISGLRIYTRELSLYAFFFPEQKCLKKAAMATRFSHFKEKSWANTMRGKSLFLDSQIYLKF